jgi:hypothetical protein
LIPEQFGFGPLQRRQNQKNMSAAANRTTRQEHFAHRWIETPTWSFEMKQVLGLTVALLLFGSGVWANVGGGSLSQHRGAWAVHATQ